MSTGSTRFYLYRNLTFGLLVVRIGVFMDDVFIIIVTYNSERDILPCLTSIQSTQGDLVVEILVIDNSSGDRTVELVRRYHPRVRVLETGSNIGYAGGNNVGILRAKGRYILLLNPDTIVNPEALRRMVQCMDACPEVAICGPTLLDAENNVWGDLRCPSLGFHVAALFCLTRFMAKRLPAHRLHVVSGACMMFRPALTDEIGMFDEAMYTYEDTDFCRRAEDRGHLIRVVREATVNHLCGQSAKSNISFVIEKGFSSHIRYLKKHTGERERVLFYVIMAIEALARWVKWRILAALCPSKESRTRASILAKCILNLPTLIQRPLEGNPRG